MADLLPRNRVLPNTTSLRGDTSQVLSSMRSPSSDAAFEQGTGINFLIPPSSVWCCRWPCVATWLMEVGGVFGCRGPMGWKGRN
ncbi:hypothetical protein TNCV_4559181 [Trichonephila clavipes]|nr:hypothetical protein TNCV_4559181 [Trichonephila clavipes]